MVINDDPIDISSGDNVSGNFSDDDYEEVLSEDNENLMSSGDEDENLMSSGDEDDNHMSSHDKDDNNSSGDNDNISSGDDNDDSDEDSSDEEEDSSDQEEEPVVQYVVRAPRIGGIRLFDYVCMFGNYMRLNPDEVRALRTQANEYPAPPIKHYVFKMTKSSVVPGKSKMTLDTSSLGCSWRSS